MPRTRAYSWLSPALFVILVLVAAATFQDYGMSWDERAQHIYGEKVLSFYTSSFTDRSALTWGDLYYYGGFFEVLAAGATRLLPLDPYDVRHLLVAIFGIAGIGGAWRLCRLLAGHRAAFFTAILLATYPAYYGHSFINSKDIPFATLYIWSLYYLVRLIKELPSASSKTALKLGVAAGLAMGVRVGGLLILCYLFAVQAIFLLKAYASRSRARSDLARLVGRITLMTAAATAVAYSVMLLFWPYALSDPIRGPINTLMWFSRERGTPSPIEYVPLHLLFKLPEFVIALFLIGAVLAASQLIGRRRRLQFEEAAPYTLLMFATVFPPSYAAFQGAYIYDEIRHFLFIIPPLFCLAGIILHHVLERIQYNRVILSLCSLAMSLHLIAMAWLLVRLHPYEYCYYNSLIGGVHGAHKKGYDVEYWASAYREGVRRLDRYLRQRDGVEFENRKYGILVGPAEWCATYYFPPNFVHVTDFEEADVYLSVTRWGSNDDYQGRKIFAITRFGAPFAVAKLLDHGTHVSQAASPHDSMESRRSPSGGGREADVSAVRGQS